MIEHNRLVSLVQRSQQGDDAALNELMNECYEGFYYFALKSTGDSEKALEATQDACVEILSTLKNLREPAAFITWSQRIIYHQCVRHQRKPVEIQAEEDEDGFTIFDRVADEDATAMPEEVYEDKEFQQTLRDLLDSIPAEQCSALMLFYYEKLSVKEIADIQGTTEGTIKSRLNYGRKAFKKKVEDYEARTGLKLHGAMPFILFRLFKDGAANLPATPALPIISGGTMAATGTAATATTATAATATAATATTATAAGATAAGVSIAAKWVIAVVAATTVLGATAGTVTLLSDSHEEEKTTQSQSAVQDPHHTADENGGENDGHLHQYSFAGDSDYNYHQMRCTCGHTAQETHRYQDEKCQVCATANPFTYELNTDNNTCTITFCPSDSALVAIPSSINGCKVTVIGEKAFRKNTAVQEIILPDTVTEIGMDAFSQCDALTKITIPSSVTTIGETAFILSEQLTDVYYTGTVSQWEALGIDREEVFLLYAKSVHCSDGDFSYLFDYQVNSDGTCTIVSDEFSMEPLVIPATLNGHKVTRVGDGSAPLSSYMGENPQREVIISQGITAISDYAFSRYTLLDKVTIPDSVTEIGSYAFQSTAIGKITLPKNLQAIGEGAFRDTALTEITLPAGITSIGEGAFTGCTALDQVIYQGTVARWKALGMDLTAILDGATAQVLQCTDGELAWGYAYEVNPDGVSCTITSVLRSDNHLVFPSVLDGYTVTRIGSGGELINRWALNWVESVILPEGVIEISDYAFYAFDHLSEIKLPSTLVRIGDHAFADCDAMESILLPDGLVEIGNMAFGYCDLLAQINIPDSVTTIGIQAFAECDSLVEITLPDKVTRIEDSTFQNCSNLKLLTVSASLTYIGVNSLRDCPLTEIRYGGTVSGWNAILLDSYWNLGNPTCTVYCTDGSVTVD